MTREEGEKKERISSKSKGHNQENRNMKHTINDEKRKKTETDEIKIVTRTEGE